MIVGDLVLQKRFLEEQLCSFGVVKRPPFGPSRLLRLRSAFRVSCHTGQHSSHTGQHPKGGTGPWHRWICLFRHGDCGHGLTSVSADPRRTGRSVLPEAALTGGPEVFLRPFFQLREGVVHYCTTESATVFVLTYFKYV